MTTLQMQAAIKLAQSKASERRKAFLKQFESSGCTFGNINPVQKSFRIGNVIPEPRGVMASRKLSRRII